MTRDEFEKAEAARRGKTQGEMAALGYYSAACECRGGDACPGWQMVAVPVDAPEFERRAALQTLHGLYPKPFGGG
jgi:hypothetical protein